MTGKSWFDSREGQRFVASRREHLLQGCHGYVTKDSGGFFCASKATGEVKLTTILHLVLRIGGAIPTHPYTSLWFGAQLSRVNFTYVLLSNVVCLYVVCLAIIANCTASNCGMISG
jgi:hypothetical protein